MKNIIVADHFQAVAEVKKRVYSILDKLPFETIDKFPFLEANFGFRSRRSWTRGYTRIGDSGKSSRYLGRFGIGWFADTTATTRFSHRTYCYIPFTLSDFIHPSKARRGHVGPYVVDVSMLESFCSSLDERLFCSPDAF